MTTQEKEYYDQLLKYYNKKYFMSNPNNWRELAEAAAKKDFAAYKAKKQPTPESNLDEIVVTPQGNTTQPEWTSEPEKAPKLTESEKQMQSAFTSGVSQKMNNVGNKIGTTAVETASSFTPLWWIAPTVRAGLDAKDGNYKEAATEFVLGLVSPYVLGQSIKIAPELIKTTKRGVAITRDVATKNGLNPKNFKFLGDSRFYNDLTSPYTLLARKTGNYPLTYAERKIWIKELKRGVHDGIESTVHDAMRNPNISGFKTRREANIYYKFGPKLLSGEPLTKGEEKILDELIMDPNIDMYDALDNIATLKKAHKQAVFGTHKTIRTRQPLTPEKQLRYPMDDHYVAYEWDGKTYFPFRYRKGTLRTIAADNSINWKQLGAHEYEHTVQDMHRPRLVIFDPKTEGEYGRYVNEYLDETLKNNANDVINYAGTAGKWEGSLAEMDSELKGWRAQFDYPNYTEMTPEQQQHIIDLANSRFQVYSDYSYPTALQNAIAQNYPVSDYIKSTLPNQKFHNLFLSLEKAGYKKGGKLNYLNYTQIPKGKFGLVTKYKKNVNFLQSGNELNYLPGNNTINGETTTYLKNTQQGKK